MKKGTFSKIIMGVGVCLFFSCVGVDAYIDDTGFDAIYEEEEISPAPEEEYLSAHPAAFRKQVYISPLGEIVRLDNGSEWKIDPSTQNREKVKQWMTSNVIIVVPHESWFSSYPFALVNLSTDDYIEAKVDSAPLYGGTHDYWITTIDPGHGRLRLNDGSVWNMSFLDKDTVKHWLKGDTIMIGINDGWFNSYNPNILINYTHNNYARGKCHSN